MRKNIVISPCGNKSFLFKEKWLKDTENRNFDLCLLFYHEEINDADRYNDVDYFYHLKNFKFTMLHELFTVKRPDFMDIYEHFYFLDDDIDMDTESINRMFDITKGFNAWLTQASLTQNSYCSWPILKQKENCYARYMGQIEVMAPLFSRYALQKCLDSFIVNRSSWGVDSAWSAILGNPTKKIMVIDEVQMAHTLPVGGGELYKKIQVDPHDDWAHAVKTYGAIKNNYKELGRLLKIDETHHPIHRQTIRFKGWLQWKRQQFNDLSMGWRIRNKLGMKQHS